MVFHLVLFSCAGAGFSLLKDDFTAGFRISPACIKLLSSVIENEREAALNPCSAGQAERLTGGEESLYLRTQILTGQAKRVCFWEVAFMGKEKPATIGRLCKL
jgi:hypothetical protein